MTFSASRARYFSSHWFHVEEGIQCSSYWILWLPRDLGKIITISNQADGWEKSQLPRGPLNTLLRRDAVIGHFINLKRKFFFPPNKLNIFSPQTCGAPSSTHPEICRLVGPAISEELAVLHHEFALPVTPEPLGPPSAALGWMSIKIIARNDHQRALLSM